MGYTRAGSLHGQPRQFSSGWPGPPGDSGAPAHAGQVHLGPAEDPRQVRLRVWARGCAAPPAQTPKQISPRVLGRVEARIRIPYGQGIWPAFWMLGADVKRKGWPACGEIDIMENIGREPDTVHGTVHGPRYSGANGIGKPFQIAAGRFTDDYHIYAVEWTPERIDFLVDGQSYHTVAPASLPAGTKWVYDHPFFLILNVAVGGGWPHNPDETSVFPQTMLVDYVRVYRREGAP